MAMGKMKTANISMSISPITNGLTSLPLPIAVLEICVRVIKDLAAYPDFGKRFFYVARENNTDVVKDNSASVNIQKLSG